MNKGSFKGYLLEEALAYLIRTSGYSLISSAPPGDPDLSNEYNGLNLRGRGAKHQIDVLGELNWIPAFNYPIRLMLEAKFREETTGINVIREEVGILADVNENYFMPTDTYLKPRFRYISSVFSTSGFSAPAVDLAIAHQVHLADLSIEEYDGLKQMINQVTDAIYGNDTDIPKDEAVKLRKQLRSELLGTPVDELSTDENRRTQIQELSDFIKDDYKELFIGMSKGGFMLLLKADDPEAFINYIKQNSSHDVGIHWSDSDGGVIWEITPLDDSYRLTFVLPKKLHNYIYRIAENRYEAAIEEKERHFSKITITYYDPDEDREYIVNLRFSRENLETNR